MAAYSLGKRARNVGCRSGTPRRPALASGTFADVGYTPVVVRISKLSLLAVSVSIAASCSAPAAPTKKPIPSEKLAPKAPERQFTLSEAMPPRVYHNDSGITLRMVFLEPSPGEAPEALVQFTGATFPTAGKVMLAVDRGSMVNQNWKIAYDGDERHLVSIQLYESGPYKGEFAVRLRMPRSGATSKMQLDDEASKALDSTAFIATHLRHKSEGSLDALARIDREFHQDKHTKWMEIRRKSVKTHCGQEIPYELDFASISDEELSGGEICSTSLDAVAYACKRDAQTRGELLKRVSKIRCSYGKKNDVNLTSDGTLQVSFDYHGSMNRDILYKKLGTLFDFGPIVLEDDKKRIVVFDPDDAFGKAEVLLGNDKVLYSLRLAYRTFGTWDPHGKSGYAEFRRNENGWSVDCGQKQIAFHQVSKQRRESILKNAERKGPLWKREEFSLARDNRGIYYYVDRLGSKYGGKSFRVFKGPRGQLTETQLVDIVDDSDGMIFATKRGKLRLVIGSDRMQEALWIEGKTRHRLVVLPLMENTELIYTGLGIYDSESMGTVCE